MHRVYRSALVAVALLWLGSHSFSQPAASSAPQAHPGNSAKAKSPSTKKMKGTPADKESFGEVYPLKTTLVFPPGSCFARQLDFPASNAADVAKNVGDNNSNFKLTPIPPDKVAVYYKAPAKKEAAPQKGPASQKGPAPKKQPATENERFPGQLELERQMDALSDSRDIVATAIRVPPGSADKVAQLALGSAGDIEVKSVGASCIIVVSKGQSDPVTVAALKSTISRLYGQQPSAAPAQRLFYVDATTIAQKLSDTKDSGTDTAEGNADGNSSEKQTSASKSDPTAVNSKNATSQNTAASGGSSGKSSKAKAGSTDHKTSGSDSNPTGDQSDENPADGTSKDTGDKPPAAKQTQLKSNPAQLAKPPTITAINDMLVYSNDDGSDRGIHERNRLMAILDLPRPEMLMNIWSLQASSKDYKAVTTEAESARQLIAHHNDLLQRVIDKGWESLSRQMAMNGFFNELFYWYVTQKFAETSSLIQAASSSSIPDLPNECSAVPKNTNQNTNASPSESCNSSAPKSTLVRSEVDAKRKDWGWCKNDQYCLGFSQAFEPLRPTFTNLLIGMISAQNPWCAAETAIAAMQDETTAFRAEKARGYQKCLDLMPGLSNLVAPSEVKLRDNSGAETSAVERFHSCMQDKDKQLRTFKEKTGEDCELRDRVAMNSQILAGREENLQLSCFEEQMRQSFGPVPLADPSTNRLPYQTTRAGLLRAATADFLFNYKWATQYPHDFVPYDLTQSAQELNSEFNPLVLAFNRDVAAFTENLQEELQCEYDADIKSRNIFKNGDQTFINDGMLSVRGISGVESVVDTVTQSFFDATNPPNLTDLVKSVSDAEKNTPGVLKANLTANEAAVLLGALNSVQPAQAKIGRELKLDITPHALAGASSAELEVKLTAQDVDSPTRFTADKSAEDTLSRVAKHDVSTRVRVESLKLFDVSAFSATLQRPRSKFPIVPPFFEVPYFGSFVGWPLPGAKVYHRSTAIVSAVIVPTAADLAFGIDFSADRICDEEGCHHAKSPHDFGTLPLRNFHKAVIQRLASGGKVAYTGLEMTGRPSTAECNELGLFLAPGEKEESTSGVVPPAD